MLVMVANRMAVARRVGASQAAIGARQAAGEVAFDGVAGHDRVVDQQAQRDDQRADRDLLDVHADAAA